MYPDNEKAALGGTAFVNQSQPDSTKNPAKSQAMSAAASALEVAIMLAEQGVPSFPCLADKRPACPHGFKDATIDAEALRELWRGHPGLLVGVPTGAVSGIDVLDIDPRHGGNKWLEGSAANIPPTRTHHTRSGGLNLLFLHHAGIRNSAGKIASGVEVRGEGGYIIWWPEAGLPVRHGDVLAEWPQWLAEKLLPQKREKQPLPSAPSQNSRYVEEAVRRAMASVASAPVGMRNHRLNGEAYSLGRFIPSGELCAQQIASALSSAALAAGLSRSETIATIASALRARGV